VEHLLHVVSMLNRKGRGSQHRPLKHSLLAALRDAHQDGTASCVWFRQRGAMVELCKVWVPTRKCTAVSPITHSNADLGQSSSSCVTERQSCTSIQYW